MVILVCLLAVFSTGCGETYDIQSDTEFHTALDEAIEQSLRGGDIEAIFNNLFENFSDRYSAEEMDEFAETRYTVIEKELLAKKNELEQKVMEYESKEDEYEKKLDSITDKAVYESLLEKNEKADKRYKELNEELEKTTDVYRMIEIQEEIVVLYKDFIGELEKATK